ncbi:MAG: VWA domain-containing protein [Burkholderiales bacterium]
MVNQSSFDPNALEAPLQPLDDLPRNLWLQGIINSSGSLPARLFGVASLRSKLQAGTVPDASAASWPAGGLSVPLLRALKILGLARYCEGSEILTNQVVQSLLWHADRMIDLLDEFDPPAAAEKIAEAFSADWQMRTDILSDIHYVFDDLGGVPGFDNWDSSKGLLRAEGRQALLRARKLLEDMPEISKVVRSLGRARATDEVDESRPPSIPQMEKNRNLVAEQREIRLPDAATETRGIKRSGNLTRMLPSESIWLMHPRLRLAWSARLLERTLMTYEDDDRALETVWVEREQWRPSDVTRPENKLEMGPLIVCVDTSGSMQGGREQVAKAVVLEAMRLANLQKRACYLYAFSGPGELIERRLTLDVAGLDDMIEFLSQTFHGGTDISDPIERAVQKVYESDWQLADLVIASDGEFSVTLETEQRVKTARDSLGLKVQGILINDRETPGMRQICSSIFRFDHWRRYAVAESGGATRKTFTEIYFPNALNAPGSVA